MRPLVIRFTVNIMSIASKDRFTRALLAMFSDLMASTLPSARMC